MATAAHWESGRPFSSGEVINRAIAVIRANPVPIFGIAFLFGALPQQLFQFFTESFRLSASATVPGVILLTIASALLSMFLASVVAGAIVHVTMASVENEEVTFGASASAGLAKALPLFALALLMTVALLLGFLLLVVPGIILLVIWSVASPALVAEDLGVFEAFGRSRYLTKGARWRVLGLGILMLVIFWALSAMLGVVLYAGGGLQSVGMASIPFLAFSALVGTISSAFMGTVQTNLYLALRDWKDGPRTGALAEVFA
jgi:hypothetical protein